MQPPDGRRTSFISHLRDMIGKTCVNTPSRPAMNVTIPDDVLSSARMSAAELRQEVAAFLFQQDRVTLAQAARLAEMEPLRFRHLLASRGISLHSDVADFEDDLRTLRELGRL